MIACCGSPSDVFFIEMKAMKAPQVVCGTCTALTLGRLRRSAFRISPSRVMQDTRTWSCDIPETTLWNIASERMRIRLATNTFWVERNDAYPVNSLNGPSG